MSAPAMAVVGEALVDVVDGVAIPGGSPANVAVGLARLGADVTLHTQLGQDANGDLVRAHLLADGVRVHDAGRTDEPTTAAIATFDDQQRATYEFTLSWDVALPDRLPDGAVALHGFGAIGPFVAPGRDEVERLLEAVAAGGRQLISVDPNVRPSLVDSREDAVARVERMARSAHLVKLSAEDAEFLWPETDPQDALARLLALGPALVVVTLGGDGAVAATSSRPEQPLRLPAPVIELADTVGAGDAFAAGLLDALATQGLLSVDAVPDLRELPDEVLARLLRHALLVASITCTRVGANPPLRSELPPLESIER